jgi:hypothetical protein
MPDAVELERMDAGLDDAFELTPEAAIMAEFGCNVLRSSVPLRDGLSRKNLK